jgi:hypothetical protein
LTDSAIVNSLNWYLDLEHIVKDNTNLSHVQSLCTWLGVAVKDPTMLTTVLHIDSTLKHLNKGIIVYLITHNLNLLSKAFREDWLTIDKWLNNLLRLQVNHTSSLWNNLSKSWFTTCWKSNNSSSWPVCQILRYWFTTNCILAWLCKESILLLLISQEVKTLSV